MYNSILFCFKLYYKVISYTKGPFQTSLFSCAEPNANKISSNKGFCSFTLGSAHEKSDSLKQA